jgi:hypothetical protein
MDVLASLHADFTAAKADAAAAIAKLEDTWKQLLEHLGADTAPVASEAEQDAATVAGDAVKAVESAVTQTVSPTPADVTTPQTAQ